MEIVKSTAAGEIIPVVDKIFSEFSIPSVVRSDNDPPFNGNYFHLFARNRRFKHRKITPVWPKANGEVERLVPTVKRMVKISCAGKKNFKQELNRFLRNYRATPHSSTRVPPATVSFGRAMKTKLPEMATFPPDNELRGQDSAAKHKMKVYADNKSYVKPSTLEGDTVLERRDGSKRTSDTQIVKILTR